MAITLEELQIIFRAETGSLREQIGDIQNQLSGFDRSAVNSQRILGLFGKAAIVAGVVKAGKAMAGMGKEALLMANDVVESEQLFEISLGKMADKATAWSDELGNALGLNPYALRKNTGVMNVMLGTMGVSEEAAYDMSTSLTQLSEDMASFYNISSAEAFSKIQSGMTGMGLPLKQLGILVDEETIKQYAIANGISKTGKEMTQQQKVMARYGTIMQQTMKAQGDLARTLDSPTNQLRILNNQFDQAKIALGQALQPALIAVLPHVTNFATGLTRMLKGGSGGDPLSGTINDLAGATAAIKSRVDTSIVDIVADIARLQDATEAAVDGYIQAASETRDLYININLKPQNSVYARINKIFEKLDSKIDTAASQAFKDGVKAQLDIILQDGEVTGPERQSLIDYLAEIEEKLKKEAEEKLKAIQAEVKYKLNTKEIDLPTADQMLIDAQAEYDTTIGVIEGLMAEAAAEVGIVDWTADTISANDRQRMTDAINKEIAAGEALLVSANAQVQALFEGSSLEEAVLGMYGGLTEEIKKNNAEINELLTAWLDEDDSTAYEKAMAKREQNKKLLAIASGGLTAEGKINKALMAIGGATPEEITNFVTSYNDIFGSMTEGYIERGKERENVLYNMPDSYFAKQGKTRKQMIAENNAETNAAIAQANAMLLKSVTDALGPQIDKLFNDTANADISDVSILRGAVGELAKSMDDAGQDAIGLWDWESQLGALADWLDFSSRDLDTRNKGMPDWWRDDSRLIPPQANPWQPGAVPEITIDRPRMTVQDPLFGTGQNMQQVESNFSVSIAPLTIDTAIELDGTTLGRATITAQQTVVKNTGGGRGAPSTVLLPY